jgi:hypothetical protein
MPFINGRFYINPAYGRALERARSADGVWSEQFPDFAEPPLREQDFWSDNPHKDSHEPSSGERWVTIDGHHVLIEQSSSQRSSTGPAPQPKKKSQLSERDKSYLDKYYDAVTVLAKKYNVDPALVLGLGIESGFASGGTYLRTGDAFGMTGGNTKHMTTAASPTENVRQFFDNYGNQIRGTGTDASAFINAIQGRNASAQSVKGWKVYNRANSQWEGLVHDGINTMRKDIPTYLSQKKAEQSR